MKRKFFLTLLLVGAAIISFALVGRSVAQSTNVVVTAVPTLPSGQVVHLVKVPSSISTTVRSQLLALLDPQAPTDKTVQVLLIVNNGDGTFSATIRYQ